MSLARLLAPALTLGTLTLTGCQDRADEIAADTAAAAAAADTLTTLYDRLGGEPAIGLVVDTLVAHAAADTALNFTRQGTDHEWEATPENVELLKERLVQFVGHATGGPLIYEGQDMGAAHEGMAITNAEFDRLAGHLTYALDANGVPAAERDEVLAIAETTRGAIVTAP